MTPHVWHHIGINFGPGDLELFVDGVKATRDTDIFDCGVQFPCGTPTNLGIAGNSNPWVLGAGTFTSAEGSAHPLAHPFKGAIDSFRISKARRPFDTP